MTQAAHGRRASFGQTIPHRFQPFSQLSLDCLTASHLYSYVVEDRPQDHGADEFFANHTGAP